MSRYTFKDYDIPCLELAKNLLGKTLVRKVGSSLLKGMIIETECYLGGEDKASQSYNGKRTPRNEPMFMPPGTTYVYFTYGMYHCFNVSSSGDGAAVLLRAIEPLEGMDRMEHNRSNYNKRKEPKKQKKALKKHELCNGPSKLCISFQIDRECNKWDLCTSEEMWIENNKDISEDEIVSCPRIGIDSAGVEWASKNLRFYVYKSDFVSKKDKKRESELFSNRYF